MSDMLSAMATSKEPVKPQKAAAPPDDAPCLAEEGPASRGKSAGMTRSVLNFWLDSFLLVTFVLLGWVAAVLEFVFPARADLTGWTLWGADVVFWRDVQFGVLCVLAAGIALHVMLHWSWVCGVINRQVCRRTVIRQDGTDTLIGVGLIAVILHVLAIGVLVARWALHAP